jgi:hypothetical protein
MRKSLSLFSLALGAWLSFGGEARADEQDCIGEYGEDRLGRICLDEDRSRDVPMRTVTAYDMEWVRVAEVCDGKVASVKLIYMWDPRTQASPDVDRLIRSLTVMDHFKISRQLNPTTIELRKLGILGYRRFMYVQTPQQIGVMIALIHEDYVQMCRRAFK